MHKAKQNSAKKSKSQSSLLRFLLHIIFSPLVIALIGWLYFHDLRQTTLLALYFLTAYNALVLVIKILSILISSLTLNIFSFVQNLLDIIAAIFITGFLWLTYIFIWGRNFNF